MNFYKNSGGRMDGLLYLRGAIFTTKTHFSRLLYFLNYVREDFVGLPFDYHFVVNKIDELIDRFSSSENFTKKDNIVYPLMADDLKLIRNSLELNRLTIENGSHFPESLLSCRDESVQLLRNLRLSISPPEIFIVDNFPPPYDRASFAAMTSDRGDQELYGITPGIYFLKRSLCPIYSQFLLVHEIIHTVVGKISPENLGRGLEEGLAEIVGSIYLGSHILGKEVTKTTFYHNRLGYGIEQFWQLYLDYMRMATYIYNRFGMDGLAAMLREGRAKIKELESLCFQSRYGDIKLPSGNFLDDVTDLVTYIALTFSRDFVVSPLAFYVAQFIEEKDTVDIISTKSRLNPILVEDALRELQDRVFVLVTSKGRVDMSDVKMLFSSDAIRYEIKEKT
jgi:hypothetical protein